jgi:hypothetical protein
LLVCQGISSHSSSYFHYCFCFSFLSPAARARSRSQAVQPWGCQIWAPRPIYIYIYTCFHSLAHFPQLLVLLWLLRPVRGVLRWVSAGLESLCETCLRDRLIDIPSSRPADVTGGYMYSMLRTSASGPEIGLPGRPKSGPEDRFPARKHYCVT